MDKVLAYLNNLSINRYGGYRSGTSIFGRDGGAARTYSFLYMPLIRLAIDKYNSENPDNPIRLPPLGQGPVSAEEAELFNNNFKDTINSLVVLIKSNEKLRAMLADSTSWDGPEHLKNQLQEYGGMAHALANSFEVAKFMELYFALVSRNSSASRDAGKASGTLPSGWTKHWSKEHNLHYYYSQRLGKSVWQIDKCGEGGLLRSADATRGAQRSSTGAMAATRSVGGFSEADIQRAIAESLKKGGRKTKRYKRKSKAGGKRMTLKGSMPRGPAISRSSKQSRKTGGRQKHRIKGITKKR